MRQLAVTYKLCWYTSSQWLVAYEWVIDWKVCAFHRKAESLLLGELTGFNRSNEYQNWGEISEDQYITHLSSQVINLYPVAVLAEIVEVSFESLNFGLQDSNSVEWIKKARIIWLRIDLEQCSTFLENTEDYLRNLAGKG